jgi:multidrug resistance efflux pump
MYSRLKRSGIVLLLVLLAAAIAFYVYYDRQLRYFQDTNDARIEADQATIGSKLAGYVEAVLADDNQPVAKGAKLVEIDMHLVEINDRAKLTLAYVALAKSLGLGWQTYPAIRK